MLAASESGFYGKLPCRGDFVQRRAPQTFVDVWDAWLQESLHASRELLGARWLETYLTSPVWRFVLAEGICGEVPYAGVMMPSVDRVGRYFPLTVLLPLPADSCLFEMACGAGRAWFDAAEELARAALDSGDFDFEAFDAQVKALANSLAHSDLELSGQMMTRMRANAFATTAAQWHISLLDESPRRIANALASLTLLRAFRPCAMWWTQGTESLEPAWLVTNGLPAPQSFVALLEGRWSQARWHSIALAGDTAPSPASAAAAAAESEPLLMAQQFEVRAAHPRPHRSGLQAGTEPRFVRRADIGLWGVIGAPAGAESASCLEMLADVAHDLAPQASLQAQVEALRRALQRAIGHSARASTQCQSAVAAVFFLAQGADCALVRIGSMRVLRVRGGHLSEVLGAASPRAPAAPADPPAETCERIGASAGDAELLRLLAAPAPATAAADVELHYEPLEAHDRWMLGTEEVMRPSQIERLLTAGEGVIRTIEDGLGDFLSVRIESDGTAAAEPLMVLEIRPVASTLDEAPAGEAP